MKNSDIIIIGSGMAGLSLAALLAQDGFAVTVVDRVHPEVLAAEDARTVALSAGSRDILAPLGIWDEIVKESAPIISIDVQEGHDPFLLNFDAAENGADAFGWIFPNVIVRQKLYETARDAGVKFIAPALLKDIQSDDTSVTAILQSGEKVKAKLLIGADGRHSRVRDLIGVNGVSLDYKHTALVGFVEHEHPHNGLAVERFYTEGPFAVLPFVDLDGKHRSAIVWSQHRSKNKNSPLPSLPEITAQLEPLFDERYGIIKAVGKWAQYPLTLFHAKEFIGQRVALISDAAHAIHPIAGQGLNLGMRDVAVLAEELNAARHSGIDIGGTELLETYQRRRRFDVFAMVAATDLLNRLFGNKLRTIGKLRSLSLGVVNRLPPLKRFFANTAMGK